MADVITVATALAAGTGSALLAMLLIRHLPGSAGLPARSRPAAQGAAEPVVLLFRDRRLVDASASARALLDSLPGDGDWPRLWTWLARRFEAPQRVLDIAAAEGVGMLARATGVGAATLRLRAEDLGRGVIRLEIVDPEMEHAGISVNAHSLAAMEEELSILRESVDHAPVLIWREGEGGTITWANAAYLHEVEAQMPDEVRWPLPRLIELPPETTGTRRAQIRQDDQVRWFDCQALARDDHRTVFAVPADNAVRAEQSLREFVQTLTKTFADLPIGLAIFDRNRRLQLFNPALIDLTGLAINFLTARPTLHAVLDGLRERRMVPEPKDYASWRSSIATLEAEAASGHHVETWSLPGGQTYRVTGRPHPDGAIAFLFEDISTEIAMTRRFRAELSLGAEILDGLESAVAIFDADGRRVSANSHFDVLWGADAAPTLRGYTELWRRIAADSPGFQALRRALGTGQPDESSTLNGAMAGPDQALLSWRIRPLSGGRRMVLFDQAVAAAPLAPAEAPLPEPADRVVGAA